MFSRFVLEIRVSFLSHREGLAFEENRREGMEGGQEEPQLLAGFEGCPSETEQAGKASICEGCPGRALCISQSGPDQSMNQPINGSPHRNHLSIFLNLLFYFQLQHLYITINAYCCDECLTSQRLNLDQKSLDIRMKAIAHKILVLSGKGGNFDSNVSLH